MAMAKRVETLEELEARAKSERQKEDRRLERKAEAEAVVERKRIREENKALGIKTLRFIKSRHNNT
ncbi:hypothetical protein EJ08DRAFT_645429 [Tothia fuscella]|uniref:Uncharacterized protein n=1 Tax=Tothia fuscella TaxID=1048955 RepID=A0A9P4P049_9PEZI|nr:hypothetical protein EJ08DRAFT_645429 [Tothia fuscella]